MSIQDDVLRMHENEVSPEQIADAMGIPVVSVVTILLRAGRELPPGSEHERRWGRREIGPEVRKVVIDEYLNWKTPKLTCKRLGIRKDQYWAIVNEEGVPARKWRATQDLAMLRRDAEAVDLYLQGMPVMELCAACGMGPGSLCHILNKYNVPRRQPKYTTPDGDRFVHPRELLSANESG